MVTGKHSIKALKPGKFRSHLFAGQQRYKILHEFSRPGTERSLLHHANKTLARTQSNHSLADNARTFPIADVIGCATTAENVTY